MKNLCIKKFKPSILENATLISDGSNYMRTYNLNNGYVLKVLKQPEEIDEVFRFEYGDFIKSTYKKIKNAKHIKNPSIVLPKYLYMRKDYFYAYASPYIPYKSLYQCLESYKDFDFLTAVYDKLSLRVKELNKEDINLPDLATSSNILLNPKTLDIKFIDYDGIQVGKCESLCISSLVTCPIIADRKYINDRNLLITDNFDKASLLYLYINSTTHSNVFDFEPSDFDIIDGKLVIKSDAIDSYLALRGLKGTPIEEDIRRLFIHDQDNKYLSKSIKKMNKKCNWDSSTYSFKLR